jgi:hypothetical protein
MNAIRTIGWLTGGLVLLLASHAPAAEARLDVELCTEQGFPLTGAREWSDLFADLGISARIRGIKGNDAPSIKSTGTDAAPSFKVVGILAADGKLNLPKGKFSVHDKARIEQWFAKLKGDGIEAIAEKSGAFGLLPTKFVEVHEVLAAPVDFSTKGVPPRDVAKKIADRLKYKFITDPAGQRALGGGEAVADELQGLSSGTVLAAVLRPLGLVVVPEKVGSEIRLRIADSRSAKEHWPIGWDPKANPATTSPALFKFLPVEINDTALGEALAAIGERVKLPLVIDYNGLARREVDLTSTKVSFPRANTYYAKILGQILFQAKLKYEVRVDEADKPFLWVTSL